jgi:hypothetical protein
MKRFELSIKLDSKASASTNFATFVYIIYKRAINLMVECLLYTQKVTSSNLVLPK